MVKYRLKAKSANHKKYNWGLFMKLKYKIIGGMLWVFLLAVFVSVYSLIAVTHLNTLKGELDLLTGLNDDVRTHVSAHHAWRYNILYAFTYDGAFGGGLDPDRCIYGLWYHSSAPRQVNDSVVDQLLFSIDQPHRDLHVQGAAALALREEGRIEEAQELLRYVVLPAGAVSINYLTALSNRFEELRIAKAQQMADFTNQSVTVISIVFVINFIIFVFLSWIIPKNILKPINDLSKVASDVASGKTNVNINTRNLLDDEIGALTNNMQALVTTMDSMVTDINKLQHAFNVSGDIEYRVDTSNYQNAFKEMIDGINTMVEANVKETLMCLNTLTEISGGKFDIVVEDLPGKKMVMSQTLRKVIENIKNVSDEIIDMTTQVAVDGDLNININTSKYEGSWKSIMDGLNSFAKSVDEPLQVIDEVITLMSQGVFSMEAVDKAIRAKGLEADTSNYKGTFANILAHFETTFLEISDYIIEIGRDIQSIADGDLSTTITRDFVGDFAPIKDGLNDLSIRLNKTVTEILSASDQVLLGANQISTSAVALATGASEQAGSIEELNNSIELINGKTIQNANNADSAHSLSSKSTENAEGGNAAMQQMLKAMSGIKESSSDISKIIMVIQDIAFQTNLLALNAAVEAARAGDAGKGFAVVAEEVRNLASRSQESATETTGLIGDSVNRVDTGSSIAEATANALNAIVRNADEVLEVINQISESSKDQADAVAQVSLGIGQISSVVQNNSAVSEETASAAEELNSQAELLKQLVSYFKL